jgi:hypothetical protein
VHPEAGRLKQPNLGKKGSLAFDGVTSIRDNEDCSAPRKAGLIEDRNEARL